ncbi:DUF4255 domain-containing protein [Vitiosangium sp. GDMCC 1.1324]|uniref:DUF4255 domain-containing protein n=1 Tax=Vitiosangium sp. (strain GDMCC 1.1324) TaxID=2138576 RepID=UPI000D367257|nr:DUF4255 domain-containing protein [Vitiosangium sp. GDMCC 1.1324]PTL79515.1 hypothetical protein DAT35_32380 [Vitiosangium sp. GDMCC 1.1324]
MSNHLAIATVTAALKNLVSRYALEAVPGAHVTTVPLRSLGSEGLTRGVNIFLFMASPNQAFRNDHVPTRSPQGTLIAVPRVALTLHYLFTFYGDEVRLEPQLLLGSVVTTFQRQPVLTPSLIRETIHSTPLPDLSGSNLDKQEPHVQVTPYALNLDALHKMWSSLYQVPYSLSVAYECAPVLVDADVVPTPPPPVKQVAPNTTPKP